jgi:hypothetical protein
MSTKKTNTETETTSPQTLFDELEAVVKAARVDYDKLRVKGVQSRATDLRKKLQAVKKIAQGLRVESLTLRADAHERSKARKAAKSAQASS